MTTGEKVLYRAFSLFCPLRRRLPPLPRFLKRQGGKRLYKPGRDAYTSFPDTIFYRGTQ